MKVKASQRFKKRRARSNRDPWRGIKPMDMDETVIATSAILGVLKQHENGLHYGGLTPEDAILEQVKGREQFGDTYRQRLMFKIIMDELDKRQTIRYDYERQLVTISPEWP